MKKKCYHKNIENSLNIFFQKMSVHCTASTGNKIEYSPELWTVRNISEKHMWKMIGQFVIFT